MQDSDRPITRTGRLPMRRRPLRAVRRTAGALCLPLPRMPPAVGLRVRHLGDRTARRPAPDRRHAAASGPGRPTAATPCAAPSARPAARACGTRTTRPRSASRAARSTSPPTCGPRCTSGPRACCRGSCCPRVPSRSPASPSSVDQRRTTVDAESAGGRLLSRPCSSSAGRTPVQPAAAAAAPAARLPGRSASGLATSWPQWRPRRRRSPGPDVHCPGRNANGPPQPTRRRRPFLPAGQEPCEPDREFHAPQFWPRLLTTCGVPRCVSAL